MSKAVISRRWLTVIGCIGFGLIIVAFGVYAVTSIFSLYVKTLLGVGAALALAFWIMSAMISRTARYGTNVAVMVFLAFTILIMVNFVSARRSSRIDTTTAKYFSLSEQTKKVLKNLDQDINVTTFYTDDHYRKRIAEDTLNEYALQSKRLKVTFIDPNVKPGLAITYNIDRNGTVVFESGDKREDVASFQNEEQDFTSAILKLISTEQRKLYFLDGHGEHDIDAYDENSYGDLKRIIEAENYKVEKLILAGQSSIPADCNVLVIAGPKKPLLPQEEEIIADYLDSGGVAIIMVDPTPSPSLTSLLEKWGVEARDDVIIDAFGNTMFGDPSFPVTVKYGNHDITIPMGRVMTFFPLARSVAPKTDSREELEVVKLVETSPESWGESDLETLLSKRTSQYNEGQDLPGPVSMAVAVTLKEKSETVPPPMPGQPPKEETKEKRVLVAFGDSDFATNKWLQAGNPDLFMNSVNWLAEEEELISIRPKDQEEAQVQRLSGKQLRLVTYSSVFAIPVLLLIIGGAVWFKRR